MDSRRRWGARQRLAFIDFRLYWEGRINRSDLIEKFGISPQQASGDIQEYLGVAEGQVGYDKSGKFYFPTQDFVPRIVSPDAFTYLDEVLAIGMRTATGEEVFASYAPPLGSLPVLDRRVDAGVLKGVLKAIREKQSIDLEYQSFTTPDPERRWLAPHALAFNSFRWHVRAYCEKNGDFRDFVLARIVSLHGMRAATPVSQPEADCKWNKSVTLRIGPHPDLSEPQRRQIEWDYGMENGERAFETRAAMLFYTLQVFRLDKDSKRLDPKARQIVLLNEDEVVGHL